MAISLLRRSKNMINGLRVTMQPFKYLLVLDFEATCDKHTQLQPQEIIEFPCTVISTEDWKSTNVFHEYVKPRIHPTLTPFCTDLTGIMQETVDDQPFFPEVFSNFCNWLKKENYTVENSAFVTCGDWDLRFMLPSQCALDGLPVPKHFIQWINLKRSYCDSTHYFPRSLRDMLLRLNLPLQGKLHSGIHDTENMVRIIQALHTKYDTRFNITSKIDVPNILK